jgi:hypothetical protein
MPRKTARSDPRPSVRITRGAGSGQHLASVLQEGRENANIDAGLGFIWRISVIASRMMVTQVPSRHLTKTVSACSGVSVTQASRHLRIARSAPSETNSARAFGW